MSASEVAWRVRSAGRDAADRLRIGLGWYPTLDAIRRPAELARGFHVPVVGKDLLDPVWLQRLCSRADAIEAHRLTFFDLEGHDLGNPIDWNRDHSSGHDAPTRFAPSIDYRDYAVTGDAKVVWELNRHHQLVVLARAWQATNDPRYASAVCEQMESWMAQCPFGIGMPWRSPLELAVRLINWVWTLDLTRGAALAPEFLRAWIHQAYLHVWEISRKYSRGSSANNHLIGEAAGIFVATSYFPAFPKAAAHKQESREILAREIFAQTYADGCAREHAFGYHLFIVQFFLIAGLVAKWSGEDFDRNYWDRLERMFEFVAALSEGGEPPMFGDADDGYVLDLAGGQPSVRELLSTGAVLFGRSDFRSVAGRYRESTAWMLGPWSRASFDGLPSDPVAARLKPRLFAESGYVLLQCGRRGEADAISVFFDCAELGFGPIAAHGHADALSLTLRVGGADVLVDPGTFDYFSYPAWRAYFRSTPAHNTIEVDGADQSVALGPFLWGDRAQSRLLEWNVGADGRCRVSAEHDGYERLERAVRHRRSIQLIPSDHAVTIIDSLDGEGPHRFALRFHLASACVAEARRPAELRLSVPEAIVTMAFEHGLDVSVVNADEGSPTAWASRGYHRRTPSATIEVKGTFVDHRLVQTRLTVAKAIRHTSPSYSFT